MVQQAREEQLEAVRGVYKDAGVKATVESFFSDMQDRLAAAHLVIARAGASTVTELAVAGRPSILIPLGIAMDDHQTANAKFLTDVGAGWVLQQKDMTAEGVAQWLSVRTREELSAVAQRARMHAQPYAAQRIADICEDLAGGNR